MLHGRRRVLLTVAEFAALTGEKPDTVRDKCERGVIRAKKVGSRWRVYASETAKHGGR